VCSSSNRRCAFPNSWLVVNTASAAAHSVCPSQTSPTPAQPHPVAPSPAASQPASSHPPLLHHKPQPTGLRRVLPQHQHQLQVQQQLQPWQVPTPATAAGRGQDRQALPHLSTRHGYSSSGSSSSDP
jgi:hypothetical protein